MFSYRGLSVFALALATLIAGGCAKDPLTEPSSSVLAGLTKVAANDTGVVDTPTNTGPGYFRGTVLGPSAPGAGNDSLATAPRIANVRVTIYDRAPANGADTVQAGPARGSVLTNANGEFQLPVLPAGQYVVTFVPPEGSSYHGAYAFGPLNANSSTYPWWVVLAKR